MRNGYERIINMMKNSKDSATNLFITNMDSPNACRVNNLLLRGDDLLISQHLATGWYKDKDTFIEPLKAGDMVIVVKLNDTKYAVLERMV